MTIGIALVACPPLLGLLIGAIGDPWVPTSDDALIALSTSDVLTTHMPTFGVYSRFGFHHPGPALFQTLAVPALLFGPKGLPVGAALVASASLGATAWLLWRRGGALLLWTRRPRSAGVAAAPAAAAGRDREPSRWDRRAGDTRR